MRYPNMMHKESNLLQGALELENLCLTKCSVYADQCGNQEMKSMLMDLTRTKRQHANRIKQLLGGYSQQYQ